MLTDLGRVRSAVRPRRWPPRPPTALLVSRDSAWSASMCLMAWNDPMGRPKAMRSFA